MKWAELNPDFGEVTKKEVSTKARTSQPVSSTRKTSKLGKGITLYSKKEIKKVLHDKFPTRSRRNVWMSEQSKARSPRWLGIRDAVIGRDAIKAEFIPTDFVRFPLTYKKESTGPRGVHWRGAYTDKKVLHSGDMDVDHMVPIFRAAASEKFIPGLFSDLKQKQAFTANMKNLVTVTRAENKVKGSFGITEWKPPLQSAVPKYAKAYHDVFKEYGMKMTVGEAAKYTEYTGKQPTVGLWNQEESNKINQWIATQRMKSRP